MANKEMIGKVLAVIANFPVERGKIREFAGAILDDNPVYRDRDYARSKGFADVIAPPTFPASTFQFFLDTDLWEICHELGIDLARSVHGAVEIVHHRPVCAGETLHGRMVVRDIQEKKGARGGKMTFVEVEVELCDEKDSPAVLVRHTFIERELGETADGTPGRGQSGASAR